MPLVVISGRPAVGKTVFATALAGYLARAFPDRPVVLLNDEVLGINKSSGYQSELRRLAY